MLLVLRLLAAVFFRVTCSYEPTHNTQHHKTHTQHKPDQQLSPHSNSRFLLTRRTSPIAPHSIACITAPTASAVTFVAWPPFIPLPSSHNGQSTRLHSCLCSSVHFEACVSLHSRAHGAAVLSRHLFIILRAIAISPQPAAYPHSILSAGLTAQPRLEGPNAVTCVVPINHYSHRNLRIRACRPIEQIYT